MLSPHGPGRRHICCGRASGGKNLCQRTRGWWQRAGDLPSPPLPSRLACPASRPRRWQGQCSEHRDGSRGLPAASPGGSGGAPRAAPLPDRVRATCRRACLRERPTRPQQEFILLRKITCEEGEDRPAPRDTDPVILPRKTRQRRVRGVGCVQPGVERGCFVLRGSRRCRLAFPSPRCRLGSAPCSCSPRRA